MKRTTGFRVVKDDCFNHVCYGQSNIKDQSTGNMRVLMLDCERFAYRTGDQAVPNLPDLPFTVERSEWTYFTNCIVAKVCFEEGDDQTCLDQLFGDLRLFLESLDSGLTQTVVIYPFANLGNRLLEPPECIALMQTIDRERTVHPFLLELAPFGWHKEYQMHSRIHSKSDRFREYHSLPLPIVSTGRTVAVDRSLREPTCDPLEYLSADQDRNLRLIIQKECLHQTYETRETGLFDQLCSKLGIQWEPFADHGHVSYNSRGAMIYDLIAKYAMDRIRAELLGFPVNRIRGANMFDLRKDAVRKHAELFGDRLYELQGTNRCIMRYASCHQQFSFVSRMFVNRTELPFGLVEQTDCYRLEQRGELLLGVRTRAMTMPDLHVFCASVEQALEVADRLIECSVREIRKLDYEYDFLINLSNESHLPTYRPFLLQLLERYDRRGAVIRYVDTDPTKEGRFYWTLNIEMQAMIEPTRSLEIATVQIDIGNAKTFGLNFYSMRGSQRIIEPMVVVHSAIFGTVERFMYAILSRAAANGFFPVWLAPTQVTVIPIWSTDHPLAELIHTQLLKDGIRSEFDRTDRHLNSKIKEASERWSSYIVVIGPRENLESVSFVRRSTGERVKRSLGELIEEIRQQTMGYPNTRTYEEFMNYEWSGARS